MSTDFEKTFDKKLNNLENSMFEETPSKKIAINLGIIASINAIILYIVKPIYIINIKTEGQDKKKYSINVPYYILSILLITIVVYFGLNLYKKYNKQ